MSSETRHDPKCTGVAAIAITLTSVVTLGGITAPAGAETPSADPVSVIEPSTPGCLVGAALFYPMVLGMVLVLNPASLPQTATNYWTGGKLGLGGGTFEGFLAHCGLNAGL
jgi:hypothetical protein